MARYAISLGALLGFFSVALGAFAAHGLKEKLSPYSLSVFQTGVQYQFWHALALILLGLLALRGLSITLPALCFCLGIALFSGSLYALALTDIKALGMITPLGGLAFLIGWLAFAWLSWRQL